MAHMTRVFLLSMLLAVWVGCATKQAALTSTQIAAMTTRTMDASYQRVYESIRHILQEHGYRLLQQDNTGGVIVAASARDASKSSRTWQKFWLGYVAHQRTLTQIKAHVQKLQAERQRLKLQIRETTYNGYGGKIDSKQVVTPERYTVLFDAIAVAVQQHTGGK
jgi:hypothetical protein